jgi:hypothetical protein
VLIESFVGSSDQSRASNQDIQLTQDLYIEPNHPLAKGPALLKRPCLVSFAVVDDSPGRVIFSQDGRTFVCVGLTFAEVFLDGTTSVRGALENATNHATIVSNGTAGDQLLICDGYDGYVFELSSNTFTKISAANFPGTGFPEGEALRVEYMDGYGIVLVRNSRRFQISALLDFTDWDALDVAERSEASDNLVTLTRIGRSIIFWGTATGEVWYDSGDALFPFEPVQGIFSETGAAGGITASGGTPMIRVGQGDQETVATMIQNTAGSWRVALLSQGYKSAPISTPAIEGYLGQQADPGYVFVWNVQLQGHEFIGVLMPELERTPIFDLLTKSWFYWGHWNATTCLYEPFLANSHAFSFGLKHLVTDATSGVIYELTMDANADALVA